MITEVYLKLGQCFLGWGHLFLRLADHMIAKAQERFVD